jgi:hypothetical protein
VVKRTWKAEFYPFFSRKVGEFAGGVGIPGLNLPMESIAKNPKRHQGISRVVALSEIANRGSSLREVTPQGDSESLTGVGEELLLGMPARHGGGFDNPHLSDGDGSHLRNLSEPLQSATRNP